MKFNLDFDNLEELRLKVDRVIDAIDEFEKNYKHMSDNMKDVAQAKSFENVFNKGDEILDSLNILKENAQEQEENIYKYIDGVHKINEPTSMSDYKIDTVEVEKHMKKTSNLFDIHDITVSRGFYNDNEDVEIYYKKVDDQYDEMKNDPDAKEDDLDKAYRKLQDAIDYKNDTSNNELVIEDLVRSMNKKYDDLVYYGNEINKYIDSIEDLEHFEGEFNPGFWNKYGNEIMNTITIIGIFATSPWSYILGAIEVGVALAKGEGVLLAATTFIPFEKAIGPLFKGAVKASDEVFGALFKKGSKAAKKVDAPYEKCLIGG